MDSAEHYAVKAHELMKKAQKTIKGTKWENVGSFFGNLTTNKS